jgi:hypothetical protein
MTKASRNSSTWARQGQWSVRILTRVDQSETSIRSNKWYRGGKKMRMKKQPKPPLLPPSAPIACKLTSEELCSPRFDVESSNLSWTVPGQPYELLPGSPPGWNENSSRNTGCLRTPPSLIIPINELPLTATTKGPSHCSAAPTMQSACPSRSFTLSEPSIDTPGLDSEFFPTWPKPQFLSFHFQAYGTRQLGML